MLKDVLYDSRRLSDFGIRAFCRSPHAKPAPNIETTHVNGMNGDLHFYYGDFQNVELTYLCVLGRDYERNFSDFMEFVYSGSGYRRLDDERFPDEYREAAVIGTPSIQDSSKSFELTFSCRPQRFLTSGEKTQTFSASGKIYNPTLFDAYPLIHVTGTGALKIGDETITVNTNSTFIDIDCALQDAFCGTVNMNGNITLSSGEFFHLKPGSSGVVPASGMTADITPRWYRI